MTENIAIILGGTSPHIELVQNLKARGYKTVLIDYLENPPAAQYADEHIRESTLDYDKVLEIAKEKCANLVISTCIDQANISACYTAEKLGLTKPYSYKIALDVTNKELMKTIFVENGIPTSKYVCTTSLENYDITGMKFPLVVKPVDCNGSKGVRKALDEKEVEIYLKDALSLSRTHNAIIEEFKEGMEIQVDCYIKNGKAQVIMTRQKRKFFMDNADELQSVGSVVPAEVSENVQNEIGIIANNIAKAFKLKNTPMFFQAIVKDDEISVIEFAPRIGGGLSYQMLRLITGIDIIDVAVDSFLEKESNIEIKSPEFLYATNLIYASEGIFDRIVGYEKLLEDGKIEKFYITKTQGTEIDPGMASKNRVGAFLIKARTKEELYENIKRVNAAIEVYSTQNEPMMLRDIYDKEIIY